MKNECRKIVASEEWHFVKQFVVLEYGTACRSEPKMKNLECSEMTAF